ncbi:glycosyltransferase [Alsobacter sp. KACC 23698]|uniref:Glycosyltransferase n=1 Tax=Alsobacter sp. KACC 23698 TaxID=3149229 RepID=A0AAU7JIJ9_9HYPH
MPIAQLTSSGAKLAFGLLPPWAQYHLVGRWRRPPTHEYFSARNERDLDWAVLEKNILPARQRSATAIWFLPTHSWNSGAFQRPQQLARGLAESGAEVLYFEQWTFNHDVALSTVPTAKGALWEVEDRLHVVRAPDSAVAAMVARHQPAAVIMFWPQQAQRALPADLARADAAPRAVKVIYDVIDELSLLDDADAVRQAHEEWVRGADLLIATADDLSHDLRSRRNDVVQLPNAVRLEDWSGADLPVPADLLKARCAPVVVGYYGAIAPWFDWKLWRAAARLRPDWAFVLIGYPYASSEESIRERIATEPNMFFLGKKPYGELPQYLRHFDVACIPFILNPITHACSPVKLFEYFAGGKPVVSTPMREVLKYKSILLAATASEFVAQVEAAQERSRQPEYQSLLAREARENTWRERANTLLDAVRHGPSRASELRRSENAPADAKAGANAIGREGHG